jgi:hypothetical protein
MGFQVNSLTGNIEPGIFPLKTRHQDLVRSNPESKPSASWLAHYRTSRSDVRLGSAARERRTHRLASQEAAGHTSNRTMLPSEPRMQTGESYRQYLETRLGLKTERLGTGTHFSDYPVFTGT